MHWESGFCVLFVNVNASQMGVFVDNFAIIGIVNGQQFPLRELEVDKSET